MEAIGTRWLWVEAMSELGTQQQKGCVRVAASAIRTYANSCSGGAVRVKGRWITSDDRSRLRLHKNRSMVRYVNKNAAVWRM